MDCRLRFGFVAALGCSFDATAAGAGGEPANDTTDADTSSYVEELERRADSLGWLEESGDLPSGDALAAEIARFLRDREADDDAPEPGGRG